MMDLADVAQTYRDAIRHGNPPTQAVQQRFGLARSTAERRIRRCRAEGLLATPTRGAASTLGEHYPRKVRWADLSESWLACACCKQPWPCEDAG